MPRAHDKTHALSHVSCCLPRFIASNAQQYLPTDAYAKASAEYCRVADGTGAKAAGAQKGARGGAASSGALVIFDDGKT